MWLLCVLDKNDVKQRETKNKNNLLPNLLTPRNNPAPKYNDSNNGKTICSQLFVSMQYPNKGPEKSYSGPQ